MLDSLLPNFQTALPLGAAAFYVFDCAQMLWVEDLLFIANGKQWRAADISDRALSGRRLSFPTLLQPWRALLLSRWMDVPEPSSAVADDLQARMESLRPVQALCTVLGVMLLVALPLLSLTMDIGWVLLALFGAYYALIVVGLVLIYRRRLVLQVTGRAFWSIAFDVIACAPWAVNMVSRITRRWTVAANPWSFARAHLSAEERSRMREELQTRIDLLQSTLEEHSPQADKLVLLRQRLVEELS